MQFIDLDFVADQVQSNYDIDPQYFLEDEACIIFDSTPVFVTRFEDHFVLDVEGITYQVPRF